MARTLDQVEAEIQVLQSYADKLRAARDEAIIAAHTFTADDYRVVVSHDDTYVDSFEDIWGCSDPAEIDDPESEYNEWREAYENGDGIYSFNVSLERQNPVDGEFETIDACGGFYSLTECIPRDVRDLMAEHMSSELPDGININDIECYCMQSHYIADMARPGGAEPMCITCADNYYTCDICDNETHADNLVGWDGAPICFACDETHGADCATCGQRMLATDAREHCKPRKP
ncbi:hypothetical protein Q3G72_035161 [Acer saccharum]|nr:hypothetical protein Q3G72_033571 [Acer saccharum]KAK1548574.1 hypothetical protein Q3G72_035161 [Acer saccharum]